MNLQIFNFNGMNHRVLKDENGDPWFVAKDACAILNIDTSNLSKVLDIDEVKTVHCTAIGIAHKKGNQMVAIVNEPGLYSLIFKSRKPEAKQFKRWVTHTVLPSIRKTGGYIYGEENCESEEELVLRAMRVLHNKVEEQRKKIEENLSVQAYIGFHKHSYLTHRDKIRLGKLAVKKASEYGIELPREHREVINKWGTVKDTSIRLYPKHILDEAWKELSY